MKRISLLVCALVAVTETYRRGYAGAVIFGWRQWARARPDRFYQPDPTA